MVKHRHNPISLRDRHTRRSSRQTEGGIRTALTLAGFAKSTGVGPAKRIVLQLDNAGWHGPENLSLPDGLRLVFQPAHSPEPQPAERLWEFLDEPLANRCFETLGDLGKAAGQRCVELTKQTEIIRASTLFHWWPRQNIEM